MCVLCCRVLRELAGVEQHEFINQLCGDQALRLLTPQSKSGAMFFLSADERFLVRTITCAEKKLLLSLLQRYVEHINKCADDALAIHPTLHHAPPSQLAALGYSIVSRQHAQCYLPSRHAAFMLSPGTDSEQVVASYVAKGCFSYPCPLCCCRLARVCVCVAFRRQPNSLLTRFYGLHRVSATKGGVGKKVSSR